MRGARLAVGHPQAWRMVRLCEVAELNPRVFDKPSDDALVSFVPMAAVDAETATVSAAEERPYGEVKKGYTGFLQGDILVAKITPCFENGKIAQANVPHRFGFGSTEFHVIRPKSGNLDARYLLHFLRQERVKREGERKMTGSGGQRRVPESFLSSFEIPLPSLAEQRRIADILDRAEALRAKRREALGRVDELVQAMFLEMFGDPIRNPKSWQRNTLKQLGRVVTGGTPPSAKTGMFDGPVPFVTPGDLESGLPPKRSLTEDGAEESETVRAGAALVCCIGSIGKMARAQVRSAFNQQINAVEWGQSIDDYYGIEVLRFYRPVLAAAGASTTLPILRKSSFEKLTIPVPPLPLQREFARRIAAIDRLKAAQRASLAEMDALFASLQQRAFRGEL